MLGARAVLVIALVAACGDDDPPPPPPKPAGAAAAAAAAAADDKSKLQPRSHIENRVQCQTGEKPSGPACDPTSPVCDTGLYCLAVGTGHSCEPCPERDSIRHEFRDRDFIADQSRDPFQSFVIIQAGVGAVAGNSKPEVTKNCQRADQLIAMNYSYQDLKLVGIVAQGTQRKVLMMDTGNFGHIIKRGDCVGKEKAVVKDIGTGSVTFQIDEDPETKRAAEEHSVQLHPGGLQVPVPAPSDNTGPTINAPVVTPTNAAPSTNAAPPPTVLPAPNPGASGVPAGNTGKPAAKP